MTLCTPTVKGIYGAVALRIGAVLGSLGGIFG
jgi:hypothetical protein